MPLPGIDKMKRVKNSQRDRVCLEENEGFGGVELSTADIKLKFLYLCISG